MKRAFSYLIGVVTAILLLLWITSPWIIRPILNDLLMPYNLSLGENSSIRINPFKASLIIEQLSLNAGEVSDFTLSEARIDVDLFALFSNTLKFEHLSFSGLKLEIKQTEEGLIIAGIDLPSGPQHSDQPKSPESATSPPSNSTKDYQLTIPEFVIKNALISFNDKGEHHKLRLEQLTLLNISINKNNQRLDLRLNGDIDKAPINLDVNLNIQKTGGNIQAQIRLSDYNLAKLKRIAGDKVQQLEGLFSASSNIDIKLTDDLSNVQVNIPDTELSLTSLAIKSEPYQYATDSQIFNLKNIVIHKIGDKDPHIQLGQFELKQPTTFSIADNNIKPAFNKHFQIKEFTTGPYDNQKTKQNSAFKLVGNDTEYTKFNFDGWSQPFAKKLSLMLKSEIKELSLPMISPYVANNLGLELKTGQIDTVTKVNITDNQIKGDSHLFIRGLKLDKASDFDKHSLADGKALSLNTALSILQDDQGNISLQIPLSGDVDSPDFGTKSFTDIIIKKAVMVAAKDYLITAFVPYANVVKVVSIAGSYALKVNIEPLVFSPAQVEFNKQQSEYLDQLALLINDSKDKQIKACAFADNKDIKASQLNLNDSQIQQLAALSETRVKAVKRYLVNQGKVASNRILLCTHSINADEDSQPQITFSLQ